MDTLPFGSFSMVGFWGPVLSSKPLIMPKLFGMSLLDSVAGAALADSFSCGVWIGPFER
jgi:hypothetical protein